MSSFEKVRPGMSPLFFSQKMAAKDPEKKIDPLNSSKCNHTLTWNTSNTITN